MDLTIEGKYRLKKKIGFGTFGEIFHGVDLQTRENVAIKLEKRDSRTPQLRNEHRIYKHLSGLDGFPRVRYFTTDDYYSILVMDLLGPSLEKVFECRNRQLSIKTISSLGCEMLHCIQELHKKNYIHRDIKPDNFLVGKDDPKRVYMIDFGLSKKYKTSKNQHIPFANGKSLTGTARYASCNVHNGIEQSRRDDLESLCYVLIYFAKGQLPWQGLKSESRVQKYEKIKELKNRISIDELCENLPATFNVILSHCRNLKFDETPNYKFIHQNLKINLAG